MAKEPGNSRNRARQIDVTSQLKTFRNRVGDGDRFDFFRFNLTNRSSFSLSLKGLSSNANVALLDNRGRALQQARRPGRRNEVLDAELEAGVYFVRINFVRTNSRRNNTRYRLQLNAIEVTVPPVPLPGNPPTNNPPGGSTQPPNGSPPNGSNTGDPGGSTQPPPVPANIAPTLTVNSGLSVTRLGSGTIGGTFLQATDPEQTATQLTYTLTSLPKWGDLFLNGSRLGVNSTFTQDDLNNNRVRYQNTLTAQLGDGKTLTSAPKISGSNVVWAASDGQDSEIFFYNGTTVTQLTFNTVDDLTPQISGSNLTWQSGTGGNAEIFFYEGSTGTLKQLTNNTFREDVNPRIEGSIVVWEEIVGDSDVKVYEHSSGVISTIPGGIQNDTNPHLSSSYVVFERRNTGSAAIDGIYSYNLSLAPNNRVPVQLTSGTQTKLGGISGSTVVWERQQSNPTERDVEYQTIGNSSQFISSVDYDDYSPRISESSLVFVRDRLTSDVEDGIYYLANLSNPNSAIRISDNKNNIPFAISSSNSGSNSGANVVWQSNDGSDLEIFFYNAATGTSTAITENSLNDSDASISGSNIVWQGGTGNSRTQVFFYNSAATNDSFNLQLSDGTTALNTTFSIALQLPS